MTGSTYAIGVPSRLGTYKNAACKGGIFVPAVWLS
ncbi:hypothetical protein GPNADHDJ_01923 [Stenotrophomonas maltophilia]|uniref:Uncharacterized protein n=1 Tax=Stenotrophomonas maltophilia TaxID=40324 RepID=A0AAX1IC97_STEMA|nr:hypothetical protein GPNADHDJ_01923 [Stenotrophomonas maltophilia]